MAPVTVMRRVVFVGIAALACSLTLPSPAARAQAGNDAVAPIQQLQDALVGVMKAGQSTSFSHRYQMLAPALDNAFDLGIVLRTSVGPIWTTLPPEQQGELARTFRRYTIASFVSNFDTYTGQQVRVLPSARPAGAVVVSTQIVSPSGKASTVDYVMRQTASGWKAVDVLLDGSISRVAVQRSDFRSLLAAGDGARLLTNLQRKIADLSGG